MISGSRELLTPGTWKKEGVSYKLETGEITSESRLQNITNLKNALSEYSKNHNNQFPSNLVTHIPDEITCPTPSKGFYIYFPPTENSKPSDILAIEPLTYQGEVHAILNNSEITQLKRQEAQNLTNEENEL